VFSSSNGGIKQGKNFTGIRGSKHEQQLNYLSSNFNSAKVGNLGIEFSVKRAIVGALHSFLERPLSLLERPLSLLKRPLFLLERPLSLLERPLSLLERPLSLL